MVALVVTIVVLLILASISIQGITRTGIFRAAEDTKLEHKRAAIATTLQTKLKINQTEQIRGTDEEIIRETYEDVKNDLEEIKKAGGKDIEVSEVTSEEKDGKTEWFFEVKVDGDVYKVGLDGSDYLGKEDELSPVIQIKVVKTTTNTIAVTATTRRNEGGKIEYYIKEKGSTNFNLVETTDQNEFTYTKLKQDTTFVVKAVAIGKNGQKKASNELEAKTSIVPKLDSNDIKFAAKPDTWTKESVEVTATDNASGIKSYAISESSQTPTKFTIVDNTKLLNKIIENVKQSTKYYVWVKDEAGNISNAAEVTTATVPKLTNANTTITKTPSDWTNQSVTAKAETTEKGYSLQTKKDNGEWQNTDTQNYTENGTIYARLWDGTNAGEETYANITNIDKAAPTSTGAEIKNVTAAGYDVYVYGVKDAGSGVNRVQFPTWTEANGQDDIQGSWQTSTAAKGTKQQDGTTWVYHVNITDHKTEAGVYNTHVYAYDNLGNGKYIFGQQITVPKVKITYDENYIANGETESKKQTVEKIYNTELGTLSTPTRTGYTFVGWFTEKSGGTQISGTTKTPVSDTTYYAHWTANQLNFANQTITKTFSTNAQTANITAASNGTGSYTYTEKTETNASGTATNYITLNGTTITIAANTPADTYTYVIVATDNNSKVTKEATYIIKIERAKTANAGTSDKTYNGTSQTGVTGTSVTWTGTTSAIDAGTYTANATPDANHAWSDGTTNAKAITWKINPKSVAVTWGTTTTFTYNGNAQAPTAAATSGVANETINVTRTTETNAGSYTSTASISSVTGGRARKENYTLTGNTKAFTINKASVATPANLSVSTAGIVTWSGATNATSYEISINGSNWTAATSGVNYLSTIIGATGNRTVYVRAINKDSNNYATPSGNATKAVAVYALTINSNSTTMGTVDTASYNVISGATYTTSGNKLTIKGITTGTTTSDLKTITATNKTGYTFSSWSSTSGKIDAKKTVTATFTANPINFANQTITKTFSTGAQTAGITGASNGTGSYTYTEKSEKNASGTATNYISISGTTINIAANTPAGTYTYVITATDNGSKVTKDATYTITIGKAAATNPTLSNTTLTYNGAAQYVTVSGGYGGTIYYRTSTNNSSWGSWTTTKPSLTDVGTIYVQAYVAGDGNHNNTGATGSVTLRMNPKSVAVTWGITTTFNYNGGAQAPTAAATSGVSGETINVTRTTATNAGSYTSTASISSVSGGRAKAGNYTLTGTTKAFTINPSSTAIKVYYPTSATGVGSKTVYRNKCSSSSTVLSTTNTGTSNNVLASTYNGLYGSFGGYATTVNTTARATTTITGIATRTETTYYIVTTGSNTSSITATFNYYNGSAWTSTTKAGTRTNNYTYYCTSTTASKTATSYSHGSIAAPSTSTGPYSTAYVGWSTGSKSMSTTSVTTANTTYYAVYRSNVTVKVVTGTAAANVTSKTIYRNAMKDGTVLSESNTGTSNLTTISGAYNYAGLATSSGTGTITAITTCAASTTNTFYTVGITKSNATITVTYKYQNGSNDTTATGTKTTTTKYYINSANQVSSTTTVSSPSFTMPKPTRTGYEMDGWNTSSTATTATYTAGQKVSIGNSTTLYAIWYQCAAKINTTYYRTVQKAIDSVATSTSTSTTVTVLKNVTENITILENKIIALNLNEKTIKGDVSNKGTLNIYGGTVDGKSAKKSNCIANIGTLTVTNGTYSGKDQGIYNYSGTTTVKGGTISGGNWGIYGDGMIIVSGGNSTGSSYAGIGTCQGTLKITGGSFTGGYNGIRVWDNNANATIEITNGTFTGKTDSGLLVKKTKATISGGTYDGKDGTDGGYFEQCNAEIKGGTFTGKNYGLKNINGTFTITGGKFRGNTEDGFFNEKGTSYINGGYFTGYKWGINSPSGKIWYHRTDAQYSDNKYVSSQGWSAVTASDLSFY